MDSASFQEEIEKAKAVVAKDCVDGNKREWLQCNVDSYDSPANRIQLLVLKGSPPRGWVIVNYPEGVIQGFDGVGRKLFTRKFGYTIKPETE
jgi:hypothetical protein